MTEEAAETTSLAGILSGEESHEAPAKAEAEADPGEKKEAAPPAATESEGKEEPAKEEAKDEGTDKARDEKGRFVPKEEADAIKKALKDERRKRQELQGKIDAKSKAELPDPFAEPDKYVDARLSEFDGKVDSRFFDYSEYHAKKRYADYEEVVSEFMEDAAEDHALTQIFPQVKAHVDPADFLYNHAKQRRELKAVDGDLGKFRESVETPLKTELSEAQKKIAALESQLKNLSKVSSSMNDEQSDTSVAVANDSAQPTPLSDILKPKKRA